MAKSKAPRALRRPVKATPTLPLLLTASPIVEDYAAILQLLYRYCHVVDRGTLDEIVALFHPDALLLPLYESAERYEGRDAVRGWYERWIVTTRATVRSLRHTIAVPVIEIAENEATAVCYVDVDSVPVATNTPWVVHGRYEDKLIKDGGRWWFKERAIIVSSTSKGQSLKSKVSNRFEGKSK